MFDWVREGGGRKRERVYMSQNRAIWPSQTKFSMLYIGNQWLHPRQQLLVRCDKSDHALSLHNCPPTNALPVPPSFPTLIVAPLLFPLYCYIFTVWDSRHAVENAFARWYYRISKVKLSVESHARFCLSSRSQPHLRIPSPVHEDLSYCYNVLVCLTFEYVRCTLASFPLCRGDWRTKIPTETSAWLLRVEYWALITATVGSLHDESMYVW